MEKYVLMTKKGEKITYIMATNIDEATELFSMKKKITIEDLLKIYDVKKFDLDLCS